LNWKTKAFRASFLSKNEVTDSELAFIVWALEEKNFSDALRTINAWLQSQRSVVQCRIRVAASKLELKALEEQLRELIDKRNTRIQLLDDFNDLYSPVLGH
jgi:thiamine monophosphate synthase